MVYEFERVNGDGQDPGATINKFFQDAHKFLDNTKRDFNNQVNTPENRDKLKGLGDQITGQMQDMGRDLGRQGKELGESVQRQMNEHPSDEDKRRLQDAGKQIGDGLAGAAGQLKKHGGLGGVFGDLFGKGNEAVTKLDTDEFCQFVRKNFSILDANGNGYIDSDEVTNAGKDFMFKVQNAYGLSVLAKRYDDLRNLSNDEWFSESKGISLADIKALENAKKNGTGFSAYAGAAWDGISSSPLTTLVTGGIGYGVGRSANLSNMRSLGLGVAAGTVLWGAYGAIDYATSRKDHIETMLKELG